MIDTVTRSIAIRILRCVLFLAVGTCLGTTAAMAGETGNSPYLSRVIKGQEDFVHVWTLGVKGIGDESDKLVTVATNPRSQNYGKVVSSVSVGGRGEAHQLGFTDDRRLLWAGRLDDSRIFIFDVAGNPARPRLVRTIEDLPAKTGFAGPRTFLALPGRMLVQSLSNARDGGGVTGMALYSSKGEFLARYDMPTGELDGVRGDGHGGDLAVNPQKTLLLTSGFTGRNNYMMDIGRLVKDAEAMKRFGNTLVLWDLKTLAPLKFFRVPGGPMDIRWSPNPADTWAVVVSTLTARLTLIGKDAKGEWQAREVATLGDPAKFPLPAGISLTTSGRGLWVNTFMDGTTRYFDLSNPEAPKQTYAKQTGSQVAGIAQSWDGRRVYVTSSLLSGWDRTAPDDQQFLKLYHWNGKELAEAWSIDFYREKLGRAHHMRFSTRVPRPAVERSGRGPE